MNRKIKKGLLFLFLGVHFFVKTEKPKLTIVFVIDQFAYRYLTKLRPHLQYGIKTLLDNGVQYVNAHHPHAKPATATGHAALNTGAFAQDHGFIANKWILSNGEKTTAVADFSEKGRLLTSLDNPDIGASPHYLMVDGISDQFILSETPDEKHHVYSLSYKNRAAIATAGKLGKAIWFDTDKGLFSSSKSYFDTLPVWINEFNQAAGISNLTEIEWKLFYPNNDKKYNFFDINKYVNTRPEKSIIGEPIYLRDMSDKDKYHWYVRTPESNGQLIDLAKKCITTHIKSDINDHMLLWVCVSGIDKLGHTFGPNTKEMIDMIYHLDKQIEDLMLFAQTYIDKKKILFLFTSDHGVSPAPESLYKKGIDFVFRVNQKNVLFNTNRYLYERFFIQDLISNILMPHIYINKDIWSKIDQELQKKILSEIKTYFMNIPGVKNIWTKQEIQSLSEEKYTFIWRLKKQMYQDRSGDLLFQMNPFSVMCGFPRGANHKTPYRYDTHIPLVFYQSDKYEKKVIHDPVWTTQVANTLSIILETPQPSCAQLEILPGLFKSYTEEKIKN